jgi:apolipoprotein N-acyltransferase
VPAFRRAIHARFTSALELASDTSADLFLWPEGGAMLGDLRSSTATGPDTVRSVLLVNTIDVAADGRRRNRIVALDGEGPPQIYEKRWLVPIAERGYRRGEALPVFDTRAGRIGSLICFEVCFPAPARERVERGAELLFASTNDGAFGTTALALLHRDNARMRAIETGRPVLFISNDGPSALIDRRGRIVRELAMGETGVLEGQAELATGTTVHQRVAPASPPLLWIGALLVLAATRRRVVAPRRIPWSICTVATSRTRTGTPSCATITMLPICFVSVASPMPCTSNDSPLRVIWPPPTFRLFDSSASISCSKVSWYLISRSVSTMTWYCFS